MKKNPLALLSLLLIITFVIAQNKKSRDSLKTNKEIVIKTISDTVKKDSFQNKIKTAFYKDKVQISYYADKFHGRKTASGAPFDMHKLTAAHKKLPFGTLLRVTNPKNNKSVIVEVNDRGPYIKGRELDLSRMAFSKIANINSGHIEANLEIVTK